MGTDFSLDELNPTSLRRTRSYENDHVGQSRSGKSPKDCRFDPPADAQPSRPMELGAVS